MPADAAKRSAADGSAGPRVLTGHGARATEELVLDHLDAHLDDLRQAPELLASPVRVVVPSISLRNHLSARIVERRGAAAGVQVTTLWNVALELLRGAGRSPGRGSALFEVLVRRFARREPALADRLDELDDGYAIVVASVRDFLDAGLEPEHGEILDELLGSPDVATLATPAEISRARALVRLAAGSQLALEELGLGHRSALLREARDALESGVAPFPARALFIHGFADATGVVTDLLASLLGVAGGTLFLDRPPDPEGAFQIAHTERFAGRLELFAPVVEAPAGREITPSAPPTLLAANDPDDELREVARRIRDLMDDGVRPEAIAVVARQLEPFTLALRRHLRALGIPFSAVAAPGPASPGGREITALRELLHRGPALSLERWLDIWRGRASIGADPPSAAELRRFFSGHGASRLADAERLVDTASNPSPTSPALQAVARAAAELAAVLGSTEQRGSRPFAEHVAALRQITRIYLAWPADAPAGRLLSAVLNGLDVPLELPLAGDEFTLLLDRPLAEAGRLDVGGRGGGVQVLGAAEARGATFEHLFLVGMIRGLFPRPIRDDALLPDRLRRGLRRLLPDLPIRAAGFDEERYLFAQLLSAAPRVTISWHEEGATGEAAAPSPMLERLRPMAPDGEIDDGTDDKPDDRIIQRAPPLLAPSGATRTVFEELTATGLQGDRRRLAELLPITFEDVRHELCSGPSELELPGAAQLTAARLAVLGEVDPDRRSRDGRRLSSRPGPYFGFLAAPDLPEDPRRRDVWITALENLAACPWQTFLRRLLRLEPLPDPLAALPSLRGLLVGSLVHETLEEVARRGGPWPDEATLTTILETHAETVLASHGLALPGLSRAATSQARPFLEAARRLDWSDEAPAVERVEEREAIRHGDRALRFKADRVDATPDGLVYTDYKTGSRRPRRAKELLAWIENGQWLQGAAYVHAEGATRGRYLFLRPDFEDDERDVSITAADDAVRAAFAASVDRLVAAWDAGVFFPRLVEPDEDVEPARCRTCEVAEACLRQDSGARGRLRRYGEHLDEAAERGDLAEREATFHGLWSLPRRS